MPLPSFLQRNKKLEPAPRRAAAAVPEVEDSGALQAARTRARRRLIGAVVLLAVGVVVFPLVFESQPRPVATDLPIEVPARKDGGSVVPATRPQPKRQPVTTEAAPAEAPVEPGPQAAAPASAAAPVPSPVPQAAASKPAERVAAAAPRPSAPAAPAPKPAVVAKAEESQRAKSLLEGKPAAVAAESREGRFVVQVGAFTDSAALKDARQRVEKLGLKTYTQVVETDAGKRTRVRVGPFATREEADHAAAKLKSAALPAAVLTL